MLELQSITCHMKSHGAICLPPDTDKRAPLSSQLDRPVLHLSIMPLALVVDYILRWFTCL